MELTAVGWDPSNPLGLDINNMTSFNSGGVNYYKPFQSNLTPSGIKTEGSVFQHTQGYDKFGNQTVTTTSSDIPLTILRATNDQYSKSYNFREIDAGSYLPTQIYYSIDNPPPPIYAGSLTDSYTTGVPIIGRNDLPAPKLNTNAQPNKSNNNTTQSDFAKFQEWGSKQSTTQTTSGGGFSSNKKKTSSTNNSNFYNPNTPITLQNEDESNSQAIPLLIGLGILLFAMKARR
jgi:hypothetical protein